MLALAEETHELCAITRSTVPNELYEKVGMLKINPVMNLMSLYGLRDFRKYEKIFHSGIVEDINYFRSYGTKDSMIIWKREGMPHFQGIADGLVLIKSCLSHLPDHTIFKDARHEFNFVNEIQRSFDRDFADFMETLEKWTKDVADVMEGARTTVQLNLAIMTLFWTLVFTIVLSQDVRSWLMSLISYLRNLQPPKLP